MKTQIYATPAVKGLMRARSAGRYTSSDIKLIVSEVGVLACTQSKSLREHKGYIPWRTSPNYGKRLIRWTFIALLFHPPS